MDERYADVDHMDAATPEDDGPIALSSDELDGIVADSREVTPEAPMMPLSPLDTGRDEPSLVIFRRTWSGGHVASTARLFHAGARYELAGDFTPTA